MDLNSLFCNLNGLQGIILEKSNFSNEHQNLNLHGRLVFSKSRCPKCSNCFFELHQWQHKSIRLPSSGITQKVVLHLKYPRGYCLICDKVRPAELKFIHPEFRGLSCSFVEKAGRLMEETTCAAAARIMGCDRKLMWKIDQWRMKFLKQYYELPKDLDVTYMSADEVHFLTRRFSKRRHPFSSKYFIEYVTNLVCTKHSKVLFNAMGRDSKALGSCLKQLTKQQREEVKFFALDMNDGFFKAVMKLCPNAEIAVDRYHLIENMNLVFNDLRKDEYKKAKKKKDQFQLGMLESGRRFILMERNPILSIEEQNMLGKLKMLNVNINAGMLIVDYFHKILDQKSLKKFRQKLAQWYGLVRDSKLKIFRKFAMKVRAYRKHIEAYIKSNLTTALSEGLNNKIKVLKRMGYNYTNEKSFRDKILQRCGFLNSTFINTNFLFWHVSTPQI